MTKITKLKSSKMLQKTDITTLPSLPLSPQENLNKLNKQQNIDAEDPLIAFKRDFLSWIRAKNPNSVERRIAQGLQARLQKKYSTEDPDKMQYLTNAAFKADLYAPHITANFNAAGVAISIEEFNEVFIDTLSAVEFNHRAKHFKKTLQNYSNDVIQFGFNLLKTAIYYGKGKELINAGKPEINLTLRDGKTIINSSFKGPLGIRKQGPPAVFELIPLEQPFEIAMQWLPRLGWHFHLPQSFEYQKMYEKLGVITLVEFPNLYKKEIMSGAIGFSLSGLSWFFRENIDISASLVLLVVGGAAVLVSGISSCIKYREAMVE